MRRMIRLSQFAAALSILLASWGAFAIKVQTGSDDINLNINFQLQPRADFAWDGPAFGPSSTSDYRASPTGHLNTDFYIRRARFIGSGNAYKKYTFYIMLDSSRYGQRGNTTGNSFVQDLYVGYIPVPDFNIEAGFLYLPLSHAAMASNSQTFAIEGVSDILLYNAGRGSRQAGVQVRGLLFDKRILIRGGAYEGARTTPVATGTQAVGVNPQGIPMFGGMLRFNLIGDEPGYSYPSAYLDGKTRVSIGVGGQFQSHGGVAVTTGSTTFTDYIALAADVFADFALSGDAEAALTLGFYRFDYGSGKSSTGNGAHGEVGYRIGPIGPEANFYWFNSDTRTNNSLKVAGGVNFFLEKHNAKIQAEFASLKNGVNVDTTPALHQILIQAQAAF